MADNVDTIAKASMLGAGVGAGVGLVASLSSMEVPPAIDYSNTVDQVAITTAVDKALENKPNVKNFSNLQEYLKVEGEWIKNIAENTLKAKEVEQNARDNTENIKSNNGNRIIYNTIGGAVAGGGHAALLMSGVNGWRKRQEEQEEKEAAAAAQGGGGKNV